MAKISLIQKTNHKLEKELMTLLSADSYVKIGVLGKPDKGNVKAKTKKKGKTANGKATTSNKTVLDVALIHEFGTSEIPQRSFLRSTWDKEKNNIEKAASALIKKQAQTGTVDFDQIMEKMGVWFVGKVKKTFTNNNWKPLKDPTRGGKNSSGGATPLVDTGQLRASVAYQVVTIKSRGLSK